MSDDGRRAAWVAENRRTHEMELRLLQEFRGGEHPGVTYLRFYGEPSDAAVPGHQFWLRIEESSGDQMIAGAEGAFDMPWLRAMCECGWSAKRRKTIDSNARYLWREHVEALR